MSEFFCVAITDCEFSSIEPEVQELAGLATVSKYSCRNEEDVIDAAKDADAIIVQYAPISRRVIQALTRCKVIARYGVGVDMIDLEAASERGILVANVPDYCQEEVSDHTVALILASCRRIVQLHTSVNGGTWDFSAGGPIRRIRDLVVGLISFGRIAVRVAEKLAAFGCQLMAFDPYIDPKIARHHGVTQVGLAALLATADVVSVHAPLTEATHHMIGYEELRSMKENAFVINTSRGAVIDQEALETALDEGLIAGAALDVLEHEPIQAGSRLLGCSNVILTPHAAFYSTDSLRELQVRTARGVAEALRGEVPEGVVNRLP